jgi:hypothetical protein
MANVKFNYLYRDAGNFKKWATVVFSNPDGLTTESLTGDLRLALLESCLFIAHQIRVPEAFLFREGDATSDDHCFHEFDSVEVSLRAPDDQYSRSIGQFTAEVKREAKRGWVAFDPHDGLLQRSSYHL